MLRGACSPPPCSNNETRTTIRVTCTRITRPERMRMEQHRSRRSVAVSALENDVLGSSSMLGDNLPPLSALGAVAFIIPAVGLAAWFFYLYSQLEYITASMLTRHVPRGGNGASVIQVGGSTKDLFYYPKDTLQVSVVGEDVNKGLMEQAGMQAAVPTVAKVQSPSDLGFAPNSSVEAVVLLRKGSDMGSARLSKFLTEASRVLKPGCPLIFVEKENSSILKLLEQRKDSWSQVEFDVALEKQYAHVVGVAFKSKNYVAPSAPKAPSPPKPPKEAAPKPPKASKGFS